MTKRVYAPFVFLASAFEPYITNILAEGDWDTLTVSEIRKTLEDIFHLESGSLKRHRSEFNSLIERMMMRHVRRQNCVPL